MTTDPYAGMSPEDKARCLAQDADLAAQVAARRTIARRLLASPEPAQAVRDAWAAITNRTRP